MKHALMPSLLPALYPPWVRGLPVRVMPPVATTLGVRGHWRRA